MAFLADRLAVCGGPGNGDRHDCSEQNPAGRSTNIQAPAPIVSDSPGVTPRLRMLGEAP